MLSLKLKISANRSKKEQLFYLDHKCPDKSIVEVFEGNLDPAGWFAKLCNLNLLKIVEVGSTANAEIHLNFFDTFPNLD